MADLCAFYDSEWWTHGRDAEAVERMLAGSTEVLAAVHEGRLVGFVRALSDGAFRATVFDLIVIPPLRGLGLGSRLLEEILERPSIRAGNRVELLCLPEMAPFYERFGFRNAQTGVLRMVRGHEAAASQG